MNNTDYGKRKAYIIVIFYIIRGINHTSLDFPDDSYSYFYVIKMHFCHYREIQTKRGSD